MRSSNPFVTVIMPIRDEAAFIARSLGAVLAQDYPPDRLEVLVVDGMSGDGTREIVQQTLKHANLSTCQPANLELLDNPGRIVPTALNIGLRQARGEVIVRTDGHTEIAPDYVRQCVAVLERTGADNVGGKMTAVGQGRFGQAVSLATSSPFGVGGARFHYSDREEWVDTVYLGAWPRTVFERIGGFDEELVRNQDDEFNFRLTQAGGKIWLDPSIRSVYYSRATLRGLWKQYFQYGLYKVRVIQKRGAVPSWRHLVPAGFVLGLVGSILLALLTRQSCWLLGVVAPYALTNGIASLWTARRNWRTLPLLPLAFLILHLAYGCGFWLGLVRFGRRFLRASPVSLSDERN